MRLLREGEDHPHRGSLTGPVATTHLRLHTDSTPQHALLPVCSLDGAEGRQ